MVITISSSLSSCFHEFTNKLRYGYADPDFRGLANDALDSGDYQKALFLANKYIQSNGESSSGMFLRYRIHRKLGDDRNATEDMYGAWNHSTREYFSNRDPKSLYFSAFYIATLGDLDRANSILKLLRERHPEFFKVIEEGLAERPRIWFEEGLKLGKLEAENSQFEK